ncbi:hypothetical protein [Solibacillus sp.]|uniref:hypothetical protein n=1 Tax=Solibacillus sp. TaxID=1909654 RepID=UPI003315A612
MRTIQTEIKRAGLKEKCSTDPPAPKKKVKEQLSKWDIEELMGIRRDTYKRQNGAIRRR